MSHTNKTQYYELPQYVGSDIINPLVDTNGAYETIDTTMHNIATEVAQDSSDIVTLQSKVGSGVFQTTAQNATDAVNELVGELDTADTGIKARLTTAENDIDTLQSQMVTAQGNIVDLQNNKANASDVNALQSTVGDANSGLVKDVNALQSTVGDANSGLVKDVTAIKKCNTILHGKTYGGGADGVKTWAEIGKEAADALLAIANNALYTGKQLFIDCVFVAGLGTFIFPKAPINLTGSITGFQQQGEFATIESNQYIMRTWYFGSTNNITFKKVIIDTNGVTTSYEGADVPTTGNVTIVYHIDNNN